MLSTSAKLIISMNNETNLICEAWNEIKSDICTLLLISADKEIAKDSDKSAYNITL